MANLSITTMCNRDCAYCFSKLPINEFKSPLEMEMEFFLSILDFLELNKISQVRLLGGEPTLHPLFNSFVEVSLARGFRVLIFSNGFMPDSVISYLVETPVDRVVILINSTGFPKYSPKEKKKLTMVFQRLGKRAFLGCNIDNPGIQLNFLLELIKEYNLFPLVRLGLAHPCIDRQNKFLHPRYYIEIGEKITEFAFNAHAFEVKIELDCGFVPCMFPEEAFHLLEKKEIGLQCGPIPDILPDGRIISCYPLASLHYETFSKNQIAEELKDKFEECLKQFKCFGIFRECSICVWKQEGKCLGGCIANAMRRMHHSDFEFFMPKNSK